MQTEWGSAVLWSSAVTNEFSVATHITHPTGADVEAMLARSDVGLVRSLALDRSTREDAFSELTVANDKRTGHKHMCDPVGRNVALFVRRAIPDCVRVEKGDVGIGTDAGRAPCYASPARSVLNAVPEAMSSSSEHPSGRSSVGRASNGPGCERTCQLPVDAPGHTRTECRRSPPSRRAARRSRHSSLRRDHG